MTTMVLSLFCLAGRSEDVPPKPPSKDKEGATKSDAPPPVSPNAIFESVAALSSRLTIFNSHDDAARATYTCCRPDQKEEIERALKANEAFLTLNGDSEYADDTLIHNARIYSVSRNFRRELESLLALADKYPDSDFTDDALWRASRMYCMDANHATEMQLLRLLIRKYPRSNYADDALAAIAKELRDARDEAGALASLQLLSRAYPVSDHCDRALFELGQKYQSVGNNQGAITTYQTLIRNLPASDLADDALLQIGNCYRAMKMDSAALNAYRQLIVGSPGSELTRDAARESNAIQPGLYDLKRVVISDTAKDTFDRAMHFLRFRQYADGVAAFKAFLQRFPGNERCDDAVFQIGKCYREMNELMSKINAAQGPEDVFRLTPEWQEAARSKSSAPVGKGIETGTNAVSAFSVLVVRMRGSNLRDDALYEIAKCYEDVKNDRVAAQAYQQLIALFPGSEFESESLYRTLKYYTDPQYKDTWAADYT
jgi:TolA-binding protein